jgi:hypothetical protein
VIVAGGINSAHRVVDGGTVAGGRSAGRDAHPASAKATVAATAFMDVA